MEREEISKRIQSNQRIDKSTKEWCERLVDDIFKSFSNIKQNNYSHERDKVCSFCGCPEPNCGCR